VSKTTKILRGTLVAIAVLGCSALVVVFLANCGGEKAPTAAPEATHTAPQVTQPPAEPTFTPAVVDRSWERIQAAGKIVVGTSADYPPFESYVGPSQIDGFDIALMDEIGRRLGVPIEYRDIAFEGLGPSLLQGQIDVAIAAISRTPEREVYADFSNVYLVSEGAALAQQGADITLARLDDVARYKVGVQRNSVYQERMQTLFIDTGQMPADNLFAYAKADHAVRDLREGRIELVVMDSQPAQALAEQGGVKVVGIGGSQQYYAIALPKGAAALKAKIDEVITALYNDGTIAALSGRYLGVPQVLPTPTPAPTTTPAPMPTPVPPSACVDGLALVKHLTTEGNMQPGQPFTKGWQVQNTGTCPWSTGYRLVFVDGAKMGGEPVAVARQVKPGDSYDIQANLVTPLKPGDYQGIWQMVSGQGAAFGERLKVSVRVLAVPTVTPRPTQTPVPGIQFTVNRTEIKAGECVQFRWAVQNVREVYFYAEGQRWREHGVAGEGNSQECLPVTTTYHLRVVHRDNMVEVRDITIQVAAAPEAPQITRFTVDPAGQITRGQCVTIRWTVEGKVDTVKLTANASVLWDLAPTSGNTQDCPTAASAVAYLLEAVGPGGTSRQQNNISVVEPATATPVPPPPPEAPVIYSFSVSPNQIRAGECVAIAWSVGGGTTYSRILRNGAVILDGAGYEGQQADCLNQPGDYTYQLEALNVAKQVATQQQAVNVTEAPPQKPLAGTRWVVMAVYDPQTGSPIPLLPETPLIASFGQDGTLQGSAGCNTYSATYLADGSSFTITGLTSTQQMCSDPPGIMEQEAAFLAALPAAAGFNQQGGQLIILNAGGLKLLDLSLLLR
jgi:polar amino acid transport system substrate-binding protein